MGIPCFENQKDALARKETNNIQDAPPKICDKQATSTVDTQKGLAGLREAISDKSLIQPDHPFVIKVLGAIGFDSLAASGLTWQVDDKASAITLNENLLVTPTIETLQAPDMKKKLWLTIKHLGGK